MRKSNIRHTLLALFGLTVICCIGLWAASAILFYSPLPTRSPAQSPTPYFAKLYCPECASSGTLINIWVSPRKTGVVGKGIHGLTVTVLSQELYEGTLYYKISTGHDVGYVSYLFIERED